MATPLTEDQKSKYESAAKKYRDNNFIEGTPLHSYSPIIFMRGTEHAHPIGYKEGRQDFKRDLILGIANHKPLSAQDILRIQEVINLIK